MADQPAIGQPNGHVSLDVPTSNGYGEDNQLIAAGKAANAAGDVAAGNSGAPAVPTDPRAAMLERAAAALQAHQPGNLLADTEYPDEPGTAGLPIGAGGGPELLGRPTVSRVARTLDALAATTNNPVIASLAGEAAGRNL